MILKTKDSLEGRVSDLERAAQGAHSAEERKRAERDLAILRAGMKGEQEAAYHIDFHLKDSSNWVVIHDLRLEWNGRVAQIDHLLIDRVLEVYVVESKSFRTKIRRANGGWERLNFNHWEGIPCPVEQNQRHIVVLEELIRAANLAPTRLGMAIRPKFYNVVVVQPSCSIIGDLPDEAHIYRMDKLVSEICGQDPSAFDVLKLVSPGTLQMFALGLLEHHKPSPGGAAAWPQEPAASAALTLRDAPPGCEGCAGPVTEAEAKYCRGNAARFAGRLLCRKCQGHAPVVPPRPVPIAPRGPDDGAGDAVARCVGCGSGVDRKVVAFCRFNSKRFLGRVLCRNCQALPVARS